MISKSQGHNENYLCKIIEVKGLELVPGLDNLVRLTVDRRPILTSKNTTEGTIALYFPSGSALNAEYLSKNNEFRADTGYNADRLHKGGFFEEKGRVKPVKFKGNMSDGYIAPIESLECIIGDKYLKLKDHIGEEFDAIGDFILLKKYVVQQQKGEPGTPKDRNNPAKKYGSKVIDKQFKFHYDTSHLDKNLHRLEPEDLISISWKLHGTSFISSKVLCKREPVWHERIYRWFRKVFGYGTTTFTEFDNLYASRKVIKNEYLNPNAQHYYGEDIYKTVNDQLKDKLFTGETIYGEIVGFTESGKAIQGKYDYGCGPKEYKAYVYRITYTGDDGNVVDVPYALMAERCKELDATPVPLIFQGRARDLFEINTSNVELWREAFYTQLKLTYVKGQDSIFCNNKVPEEGIVIRREGIAPFALKLVSDAYKLGESKAKDEGIADMEEDQSGE